MRQLNDSQREQLLQALPKLRRFCLSIAGASADADDLLQATVERILQKGIAPDAEPLRWAYRVCKNIWIDELRSKEVRTRMSYKVSDETDNPPNAEQVVEGELRAEKVRAAMAKLPDEQRVALALVTLEGHSYAEAASILDIPIGTVMSRLARARAALTAMIDTDEDKP